MIQLDRKDYHKLAPGLTDIKFNCLFATAVLDQIADGRVYVDNADTPRTFYIAHKYGMSLLGGDSGNAVFNKSFRDYALNINHVRSHHEWMQVFPDAWAVCLTDLFSDTLILHENNKEELMHGVVEMNTRVNFQFDRYQYLVRREEFTSSDPVIKIVDSTSYIYDQMEGSVVPKHFWNSAADFSKVGLAYSAYVDDKLAATAFASFVAPGKLELGIETLPEFRRRHLAENVCAAMIDYCLEQELEPIWSCRLENTGSYMLAQTLGFRPYLHLPYYRLSN